MAQSLEYITRASYKHVNNNHRQLKYSQIKELKETQSDLEDLLSDIRFSFDINAFEAFATFADKKKSCLLISTQRLINKCSAQEARKKKVQNTTLFFSLMVETKDLIVATINLIEHYHLHYDPTVTPIKLGDEQKNK